MFVPMGSGDSAAGYLRPGSNALAQGGIAPINGFGFPNGKLSRTPARARAAAATSTRNAAGTGRPRLRGQQLNKAAGGSDVGRHALAAGRGLGILAPFLDLEGFVELRGGESFEIEEWGED